MEEKYFGNLFNQQQVEKIYSNNLSSEESIETIHFSNMFVKELIRSNIRGLTTYNLIKRRMGSDLFKL